MMIDSGKAPPENLPQLQFFLGQTSYDQKDLAGAQRSLEAAIAGGYRQNDVEALLAQSYISDNKIPQGLAVLRRAIDAKVAAGAKAPENWYRAGLGAAYRGKLPDQAAYFSSALVRQYPTAQNWAGAITVLRDTANYQPSELIDLLRLMGRTNSYAEERDYIEYIRAADPRRYPGEVLDVIAAGTASGKLKPTNVTVVDAKDVANRAVGTDKASLPAMERDARAASASATRVVATGDTFLSYGQPDKAIEFYTLAQSKPGVDLPLVLTRLGIAQVDKGDYAGAQATFAKVAGPRKPLAELWSIYAAQKAAGT
jgi:broad specificity phosphatase PhoE